MLVEGKLSLYLGKEKIKTSLKSKPDESKLGIKEGLREWWNVEKYTDSFNYKNAGTMIFKFILHKTTE